MKHAFLLKENKGMTRRNFLYATLAGSALAFSGLHLFKAATRLKADTFIASVKDYNADLSSIILSGMRELGIKSSEIKGKKILLKPNLVEPHAGAGHINTHPLVVRGAVEAFLNLGAAQVIVAEGSGHSLDTLRTLEESGLADVLVEDHIPFRDLNTDDVYKKINASRYTNLQELFLPIALQQADWIVSLPKMKTHHWAGVTLAMKNLFGVMPGNHYGWPKNVLHHEGIDRSILDINATVKPHFAIVDGIIGMEGDGPIMGTPKYAGTLVMGRNFPAVDATCARIMDIVPEKVPYLRLAAKNLGPIREKNIIQVGELIQAVQTRFKLIEKIPAHKQLVTS